LAGIVWASEHPIGWLCLGTVIGPALLVPVDLLGGCTDNWGLAGGTVRDRGVVGATAECKKCDGCHDVFYETKTSDDDGNDRFHQVVLGQIRGSPVVHVASLVNLDGAQDDDGRGEDEGANESQVVETTTLLIGTACLAYRVDSEDENRK